MIVSTRGRYALRVMVDLAENQSDKFIPLKDIAARQQISFKYLESIMTALSKAGLVKTAHGKGGGYSLSKAPEEYSVGSILKVTENSFAPVACLQKNAEKCESSGKCRTLPMWKEVGELIDNYFENKKLSDLVKKDD